MFKEYFFIIKKLCNSDQTINDEIVKDINDALIELKIYINRRKIPENENPNKIADIVEKILDYNKQHKGKGRPSDLAKSNASKISNSSCISKSR